MPDALQLRPASPADRAGILELLADTLGRPRDDASAQLYDWKHHENPFGRSVEWLALLEGEIVGYRAFMRWRFDLAGRGVVAVRAVDTATSPLYRRRGIFEALTRAALEDLQTQHVEFVFNTPNPRSGAGYKKMGWTEIGRVPVAARARTPRSLLRMATAARSPAGRQPEPAEAGASAHAAFADEDAVDALLARCARRDDRLRTDVTAAYLRWRYANPALGYRIITGDAGLSGGCAIFRVRRRGHAREVTLCDVLVPRDAQDLGRALALRALRETRTDSLLRTAMPAQSPGVGIRMPGQGPLLTWRGLTATERPPLERWDLVLGDLEMF